MINQHNYLNNVSIVHFIIIKNKFLFLQKL